MPSANHRRYLERASRAGYTEQQAEDALAQVRADEERGGGYVTDLYERALLRLDTGTPTGRQRADADRVLAQTGRGHMPPEVRDVVASLIGQMGLTVGPDGEPVPAGVDERFADAVDGLSGTDRLMPPVQERAPAGVAESLHYTTFVVPPGLISELPTPFLVLAAQEARDVDRLPLPTSLHRIGNEVMAYTRARALTEELGAVPVSDAWIQAVNDYEGTSKVVVVREPLPSGRLTVNEDLHVGVSGEGLPGWVQDLLDQRIAAAVREVPVSAGTDPMSIGIVPSAPGSLPGWAHHIISGEDDPSALG